MCLFVCSTTQYPNIYHIHYVYTVHEGPCVEYEVSSSLLNCKTEEDWRGVGNHQCMLRDNQTPILTKTQVSLLIINVMLLAISLFTLLYNYCSTGHQVLYPCHSFEPSPTPKFLSATFTCCSVDYRLLPTTKKSPPSSEELHPSEEPQTDGVQYEPKVQTQQKQLLLNIMCFV